MEPIAEARALYRQGLHTDEIHRRTGVNESKLRRNLSHDDKVARRTQSESPRLPEPDPLAGGPCLPDAWPLERKPPRIEGPSKGLVLSDVHLPMHDKSTVEAAVERARLEQADWVLLNGDLMDLAGASPFFREPSSKKLADEIAVGKAFLDWLRSRLPRARIVYREGNHEYRLTRWLLSALPELGGLQDARLPSILGLAGRGIEWVQDKRIVWLGGLATLHGHEIRGAGEQPARQAFAKTSSSLLLGHHHQSDEYHRRGLDGTTRSVWVVGCACHLGPDYDPYNARWNHGYAMVWIEADGSFRVDNRRVRR